MSRRGATLISVPSAFTETTGKKHWHTLLKARAIENISYYLLPVKQGNIAMEEKLWTFFNSISDGEILKEQEKKKE